MAAETDLAMTLFTVPIADLNNDILFELFALIATTDKPHALPWVSPGPLKYHLGWVRLTHVCHLWRLILLEEMPNLWADAVCRLPSAHNVMLGRARNRPLTLNLNISMGEWLNLPSGHVHHERLFNFALANITQAEAFHSLHGAEDRDWLPVLGDKHLPMLRYLELRQRDPRGDDSEFPVLRSLDAPNLVWVRLQDLAMTFTSTNIRHLVIIGHHMFCDPDWSILEVLSHLPLLEWLDIDQQPRERVDYSRYKGPPISLERMRHCRLYGNANSDFVTFNKHLLITPQVRTQMQELYYAHVITDGMTWENDFIRAFAPSLNAALFDGVIVCDEEGRVFVSAFPAVERPELVPRGCDHHVDLDIECKKDEGVAFRIGCAALAQIEPSHVKQLAFGFTIANERLVATLKALRVFSSVVDFTAMSRDVLDSLPAQEDGFMLFPKLTILHTVMEGPLNTTVLSGWWENIVEVLVSRSSAGIPIQRLRLVDDWSPVEWSKDLATIDAAGVSRVRLLVPELVDERCTSRPNGHDN